VALAQRFEFFSGLLIRIGVRPAGMPQVVLLKFGPFAAITGAHADSD
jgi:hypothetical protein